MKPAAPVDPQTQPQEPPSPIQPGQFVVAGEDDTAKKPQATLRPQQASSLPVTDGQSPYSAKNVVPSPLVPPAPPPPPQTPFSPPQSPPPQAPPSPPSSNPPSDQGPISQPDPTPFVAPQDQSSQVQKTSRITRLKKLSIIGAVLILLGLAGGVAWFFILQPQKNEEPIRTENTQGSQVIEPSSFPKRTNGGFADLPQATPEATSQATPPVSTPSP